MTQTTNNRIYIAIDLKSFYASAACREMGLDPLSANLVVADVSRTEKTICLAVSPSLKAYGIPGRARLFEVIQAVKQVNAKRRAAIHGAPFRGKSSDARELLKDPYLEVDFIVAPPKMQHYMDVSSKIYGIYLHYAAPEDIHVYSVDEVFMDVTDYLHALGLTPHEMAMRMIHDVLAATGITATAGIAPNLYLCKVAMDIVAKHIPADQDGVRIAELDVPSYRRNLWNHRPLTDFWRVGRGIARKLEANGMFTMGDVARCAMGNEDLLFRLFGVNAELLMDHAFGYEPTTIRDIKAYRPRANSISQGQVLSCPYPYEKAKLVIREMTDELVLDLVSKRLVTDQIVVTAGYDIENLSDPKISARYHGPVTTDWYGRRTPAHAHGSVNLGKFTSSTQLITEKVMELCDRILNPILLVRRMYVVAAHVRNEDEVRAEEKRAQQFEQLDLFTDYGQREREQQEEAGKEERERRAQEAMLDIKKKFGKNAIVKGMDLQEGATTIQRNRQIGGHKA
jgi:DNA polymerase V